MVFANYAKYYNLLYKDKEYSKEVEFINSLIQKYGSANVRDILDVGCGTGIHAGYMSDLKYNVTGIDLSEEMISQARAKQIPNATFEIGDAGTFSLEKKFDVITSLFHVFSYQTDTEQGLVVLKNARSHLRPDGILIFDFWYGPAVLMQKPDVRIKKLEDASIRVIRLTEPELKANENLVNVHFELMVNDKETQRTDFIHEVHSMRYFFKPEIELLLKLAGLEMLYFKEWLTGNDASEETWGVCCVAKNIN